ncbi:MAG: exodeoxyribonuclease III [Deltaproteobacteria bacterium]|nr:exodeoxyribonuclease III [Deltaproteobacteria bacterium]
MRIATWNVNGVRARLDFLLQWLAERQPDVVGLQELKVPDEQFPWAEIEKAGYHAAVHGQKSWNGVAVLAREPLEMVQRGLPGQEEAGARLLTARAGGLLFTSVYCPNGKHTGHDDFPRKLAWYDALAEHLARSHAPGTAAVVGGDFNVCPAGIDSWNEAALRGAIFHTDEERARFRRLVGAGWVDLFRARHPDLQAFSWWDYRGGAFHRRQGLRIDCLLATGPVALRVRAVEIDRDWRKKRGELTPSDHAPVWADLD